MGTQVLCNAKTRHRDRCKHQAGWGTDHLGHGSCKLHGGASAFKHGVDNPNYKHGLTAKYASEEEYRRFKAWQDAGGIRGKELPEELEFLIFRCLDRLLNVEGKPPLKSEVEADVINKLMDALLKAQKYRGADAPQKFQVTGPVPLPVFDENDAMNHFPIEHLGADAGEGADDDCDP